MVTVRGAHGIDVWRPAILKSLLYPLVQRDREVRLALCREIEELVLANIGSERANFQNPASLEILF